MNKTCSQCQADIKGCHFNRKYCSMKCKDKSKYLKSFVRLSPKYRSSINKRSASMRTQNSFKKMSEARKKWHKSNKVILKQRICKKCGIEYIPLGTKQYFCGSIKKKLGCCYKTMRERDIGYWLAREYGLTYEFFCKMFQKQDGKCKICGLPQLEKRLAIDHDHKTGKIRGLLCDKCNRGLGHFNDDTNLMKLAIDYLVENKL